MLPSSPAALLRHVLRLLVPVCALLTSYLYLYPVFQTCGFPLPSENNATGQPRSSGVSSHSPFVETAKLHLPFLRSSAGNATHPTPSRLAPFRLLALGDPQLEGDTSIPNARGASFPHLNSIVDHLTFRSEHASLRFRLRQTLHDVVDFWFEDIPNTLESIRKRIDLLGNDFYLAHIYRTVRWWSRPTHITVLGDLLGSQWLDDEEFERRADRFWNRVVRGGERVPDDIARFPSDEYDLGGYLHPEPSNETESWTRRIINVAGNHDIGYAGDINNDRLGRFERLFGRANYELRFELPPGAISEDAAATVYDEQTNSDSDRLHPELRIINLNDMNLDTPVLSTEIQDATYDFINAVINTASAVEYKGHFTVVLTHVPLYKDEGICVDPPFFAFHDHDGSLKEQNQLSSDATRGFLEGIFGFSGDTMAPGNGQGRKGVILNGHDHEGCDTYHFIDQMKGAGPSERDWEAMRWLPARDGGIVASRGRPGVREITVRSMMGDFGGNAGLLSAWFDEEAWEWRFEYATCALGRQHFWWVVHILDLVAVGLGLSYAVLTGLKAAGMDYDRWPSAKKAAASTKGCENGVKPAKPTNGAVVKPVALSNGDVYKTVEHVESR
ncbi:uncharacterized protein E0L32_003902 [Thyridium curvatum]|uniref:Protein TED1 n=1 Tax=Thyridium curvatum TaxID=1093900 RepID=A0A507B989_9PEZI|nr:uncharacterized protein E0L32_003902 [Thyridium curvatum]TPX16253.1 hypothetical protein E0L32_003902 [Thyridium curvatum]